MFWLGLSIFLCGVAVGDIVSSLNNRRTIMTAKDDLNAAIDRVAADVATLKTAADPSAAIAAAVAANQAENDAAIEAAAGRLNGIDAAPPAPAA